MPGNLGEWSFVRMALCALLVVSCSERDEAPVSPPPPEDDRVATLAEQLDQSREQARGWVSIFDPDRTWSGYTLDFFERTLPILIDMNGEIVHSWPQAQVRARLRLLPNGNLLAIGSVRSVVEYDWDGDLLWEYELEDGFYPHHDVIRLDNGNTLFISAKRGEPTDDLLEVDISGRVVWKWRSADHLSAHFGEQAEGGRDITHINSVQVLPPNPWFESGDGRFRPGNILISARNLDAIFVIDRTSNEVVWKHDIGLDRQHEAMMIASGLPGHGNIMLFNNGLNDKYTYRQSSVLEVDPTTSAVVWEYRAEDFFSPIVGVQQLLPNGNVLIGSSLGLRNFEVTRSGEIVWQWNPPFKTKRPTRYPYDYCPQLAILEERTETTVVPDKGYRHIDRLIYRFARESEKEKIEIDGQMRTVLLAKSDCRKLLLPEGTRVQLNYGVDRTRILQSGQAGFEVTFDASLKNVGSGQVLQSLHETLDAGGSSWRSHQWDVHDSAYEWAELCLEAPKMHTTTGVVTDGSAFWGDLRITSGPGRAARRWRPKVGKDEWTPDELEVRQEHLKTLGYID